MSAKSVAGLPIHPAAAVLPLLNDDELDALAADIRESGQREPITVLVDDAGNKLLLDGRNRLEACKRAGVKPLLREVSLADIGGDVASYVLAVNAFRRHLIPAQRAIAIAVLSTDKNLSARKLAEGVPGTNREYVRKAVAIVACDRDLALQVLKLEVPIERAYRFVAGDASTPSSDQPSMASVPASQEPMAEQLPVRPQPRTLRDRSGTPPAARSQPPERDVTPERERTARDVPADAATCARCGKRVIG